MSIVGYMNTGQSWSQQYVSGIHSVGLVFLGVSMYIIWILLLSTIAVEILCFSTRLSMTQPAEPLVYDARTPESFLVEINMKGGLER